MNLNPYLNFDSNCEEAFNFYAKVLGGKIVAMIRTSDTPMKGQGQADRQHKIMHARMMVGDTILMGSDAAPEYYQKAQGLTVTLNIPDAAEAERVYAELSAGGTVQMAIQETFWATRFATFADKYGTPWMVNCEKPMG
jgi:PhnB protein